MSRLDSVLLDFRSAFAAVDAEQAAPFTEPTDADIALAREGIDEIKRRNREASPTSQLLATHEGVTL